MLILYLSLCCMLLLALGILAMPAIITPFYPSKNIVFVSCVITVIATSLYFLTSRPNELKTWLTSGMQHYQLQVQVQELGGLENIIHHIENKLATNPNDAKGWMILGKLYLSQHEDAKAEQAFARAKAITKRINHGTE